MSGQLIGGVIGGVVGFFVGGPAGAAYGFSLGATAGGLIMPGELPTQYGPRLEDLRPQSSEYGRPIPIVFGTVGMGGNVIWASDYVEKEKETEQGGKGGPSQTTVQYEYFGNFAIMFCEGPNSIGRMWAGPGKRLIWDGATLEGGGSVRIYNGTEDQLPDPLIESYLGAGNVPAYRGVCYAVFEMFPLAKDGNALPFITAEVGAAPSADAPPPTYLGSSAPVPPDSPAMATVDSTTGWIWSVVPALIGGLEVTVTSDLEQTTIAELTGPIPKFTPVGIMSIPTAGEVWVVGRIFGDSGTYVAIFSAGAVNPDGTVLAPPIFQTIGKFSYVVGSGGGTSKNVTYGASCAYDPVLDMVWLACAFNNLSPVSLFQINPHSLGVVKPLDVDGSLLTSGSGYPGAMFCADGYLVMTVEAPGGGVLIGYDTRAAATLNDGGSPSRTPLLWTADVPVLGGRRSKSLDYDSKRKRFIVCSEVMSFAVIDAETGVVETYPITLGGAVDADPAPSTDGVRAVAYLESADLYYFGLTAQVGKGSTIYAINPDSFATQSVFTYEPGPYALINPLLVPADHTGAPYLLSFDAGNVKRLYFGGTAVPTGAGLGAIVANLSLRAGQPAFDVSELTDDVPGYAIARQTTVRAAIDALRPAYFFDGVESGGLVKFPKRGGESVVVIDDNDLAAHQADGEPGDPLLTTRQMEVELPKRVVVNYLSAATDYEKAAQPYNRQIGSSEEEVTLDLPLVLFDTKAQEVAQVNAHVPWVQRLAYEFTLPRRYSYLEPTDVITVKGHDMQLTKVTATPGGLLRCDAVATDSSHYTPHVIVTEPIPTEKIVYAPGETTLELM